MKNISKYIAFIALGTALVFSSCETTELDLTENPNSLTPDQASVDFFLNSIQEDFVRQLEGDADFDSNDNWVTGGNTNGDGLSLFGRELTRLSTMTNKQYNSAYQASDSDDEWTNIYLGVLADIKAMNPLAEAANQTRHIGIGQFIEAYLITVMVDFYGDIPYSEAILGTDNLNPVLDSGASVYEAALALLDDAIVNFQSSPSANPASDAFYGNDYDKWENAANTLKMRLYNQRRLVDPSAAASIQTILDSGNYITDSADDFDYVWSGTSASAPDSRHPRYGINYIATGATEYQANWLMNLMDTTDDPRIRYYFFRQTDATPGAPGIPPNEETLQCSLQSPPQHYIDGGFPFCALPNGYWGRNHGDDDGTPPDGLLRTTAGVYPAGGRFDDDSFEGATPGEGGAGVGITPILTAAWVDFMQAELAMVAGNPADARDFMVAGMTKQIAKVQSFGARDANADLSFEPSAGDVAAYIAQVAADFDAASTSGQWDILGVQLFITAHANGVESYNFYRRTGYPTSLEPNLDPSPGVFIRSLFYPSNAVNTNSNISQKADQGQAVFWDNNPSAPAAN